VKNSFHTQGVQRFGINDYPVAKEAPQKGGGQKSTREKSEKRYYQAILEKEFRNRRKSIRLTGKKKEENEQRPN